MRHADAMFASAYALLVTKRLSRTAVFEPAGDGWIQARVAELPGVITAGPTKDEAREMLLDALREYLLSLGRGDEAVEVKDPTSSEPLEIVLGA